MSERELHYFARGNTAAGLYSLTDSLFEDVETLYVIQGYPGGTAEALGRLASEWERRKWNLQLIHHPLDSDLLEAIVIEDLSVAVVDGAFWSENTSPAGAKVSFIHLDEVLGREKLAEDEDQIQALEKEIADLYAQAYATFLSTLRIHDEWEKFYIDNLDREKMDRLALDWSDTYLKPQQKEGKQARVKHRFLGAATWRGAVDYVPNLTDRLDTRIFVKGRPGSGKSTLFRKLAGLAAERGIDTEIYHCGFDPNSLDMLIFPELSLAIFDSTAPHEHFPVREGDSILDVYELAITPGTDEKYTDAIDGIKERYTASMKRSISLLAEVKQAVDRLEAIYLEAADGTILSKLLNALKGEIAEAAEAQQISSLY
ncbi:hypothetical protein DFP94_107129 [Fontibacillus phaseoli]|uniref:Nucleotide kinase n=1 Tax=Fontibacillus phaseoli TaxID=1416533 RepID=A0A369BER6_9BACL|nr:hypothetical protein [Fontibacillus phaseoli]RCX18174.1 hypothetical protein DFP94_107129 [Fontibacillus phaseoli]